MMQQFQSMLMRQLQSMLLRQLVILLGLLGTLAHAQTLEVSPWLPSTDGRTTLSGKGFDPTSTVRLEFAMPRPMLPDGKAVPNSLQANDTGEFALELKVTQSRLEVTASSGDKTARLIRTPPELEFVMDGSTVVAREAGTGKIAQRLYLSGQVKTLERTSTGYRAVAQTAPGVEEIFTFENGRILERVSFPPSNALLETINKPLRQQPSGDASTFWRERANLDPTNPLLLVQLGKALQASQPQAAKLEFAKALEVTAPFYVSVRLAQELEKAAQPDLADKALQQARTSYAASGYDPGFAVSKAALSAWGDPLETAKGLFVQKNPKRAEAWFAYLRDTSPRFAGAGTAYGEYATWLETQNRTGEARQIREFAADLDSGSVFRFGDSGLTRLSGFALAGAIVVLISYLLLQFVLMLKYWTQQTKDLAPHGGRFGALSRAPLLRLRHSLPGYQTFTEKLVSLVLLLASLAGLCIWQYSKNADALLRQPFLNLGTVGGAAYYQALGNLPNPMADYLRGLGQQLDGDLDNASQAYRSANLAGAFNNLGVIQASRGDNAGAQTSFQQAASLGSSVANQNLGSSIGGFRAAFHAAHRSGSPMLEVPAPKDLVELRFGSLEQEFRRFVQDPWGYWNAISFGLPIWAHQGLGALAFAILVLSLLWLLVPRLGSAKHAPRNLLYHLGAILLPGTGLADEVWGILLLPPAVALGALLVVQSYQLPLAESILSGSSLLGLGKLPPLVDLGTYGQYALFGLVAIYAINFVAWLLETIGLARRKTP
jgi:tetratricopeptide (TPR) repeat protein